MPIKVYYLDDEPALLEIFADTFSSEEIDVSTFQDPNNAIAAVKREPPDVIFLDYRLPNTTGTAVARQMDSRVRKVLVSGDLNISDSSAFAAIFEKPMNIDAVFAFLNGLKTDI